jgi:flavodoxin/ferredoxin
MSRGLITCFSQGGTTARVAEQISAGLVSAGHEIDICNLKDQTPPEISAYDLLGVGLPVYAFAPPFSVTDYIKSLPELNGLPFFVFVLYGTYRGDAGTRARRALEAKGGKEIGYFFCRGADYFIRYLQEGYLFSAGHPNHQELAAADDFGKKVASHLTGSPYTRPEDDQPPSFVYRLERFLLNRWLTRQLYSRLFWLNKKKCNQCGICFKLCPTKNITADKSGYPIWGRKCLDCWYCEMKCPEEAIFAPISWPLLRPFMRYNVRHASGDPTIDHIRVTHSQGKTRPVD